MTEDDMDRQTLRAAAQQRGVQVWVIVLVVSCLLLALGLQQLGFQRDAADRQRAAAARDACYERWGEGMVDTVTRRSSATTTLDEARAQLTQAASRRDDALDRVLLVVTAVRATPPQASEADLDRVLRRFGEAKADRDRVADRVERVQAETEATRASVTYPRLDCSAP